jgi:hypothetical protein
MLSLKALFSTFPYAEMVMGLTEPVPCCDYICSSARQLRFFDDRMGEGPFPYLSADPARVAMWRRRLDVGRRPFTVAFTACSRYGVPDTLVCVELWSGPDCPAGRLLGDMGARCYAKVGIDNYLFAFDR